MKIEIYPHWYQRKPVSVDHRESELRIQARHRLYISLQRAQEEKNHELFENIEHVYDELNDSENIVINPLVLEANPELKQLLKSAGFVLITETPEQHRKQQEKNQEAREKILKGGNMNKKEM